MDREELLETLDELQHDLGKHLLMPVALLPQTASHVDLRDAVDRGLRQVAAWRAFGQGSGRSLAGDQAFAVVDARVAAAAQWGVAEHLDRSRVQADFAAVGEAIRAWRRQVSGD